MEILEIVMCPAGKDVDVSKCGLSDDVQNLGSVGTKSIYMQKSFISI